MTSRERLRRCFFHEELDRPGVYFRTGWPGNDPTYEPVKAFIREHTDLKIPFALQSLEEAPRTSDRQEPHSDDFARWIVTLHTPAGDLEARTFLGLRLLPSMAETHFVKTVEDAEKWLSLPLPNLRGDASAYHQAEAAVGDRGIVDVCMGTNPAGVVADLLGSEAFAMWSLSDRDVLHAMCRRQQEIILQRVKHAISMGMGPYFSTLGQEYIVPPLHGRADFEDFCLRYDKPIFDLIHEAGGRVHVHCHSKVATVLPCFVEMGVDVLHPIEPPPMGDVTAKEAKRLLAGRICIEGNVQIANMYEHTPQQVADETAQLIEDAFGDRRGLIVCPTASLYQRGKGAECFEQVKAMVRTVRDWRGQA